MSRRSERHFSLECHPKWADVSAVCGAMTIVSMPAACVTALETQFSSSGRSIDITSRLTSPVLLVLDLRCRGLTLCAVHCVSQQLRPMSAAFWYGFSSVRSSCPKCIKLTYNRDVASAGRYDLSPELFNAIQWNLITWRNNTPSWSRKFPHFWNSKGSFLCLQEPATGPYNETDKSNPQPKNLFPQRQEQI